MFGKEDIKAIQAKSVLKMSLSEDVTQLGVFQCWLSSVCQNKDAEKLECMLILSRIFDVIDDEAIRILTEIACDDWHSQAEELVDIFRKGTDK